MNLDIVGGTYRELCKEGDWQQLFGSGLRGAASLHNAATVCLHTYVGSADQALLDTVAATFNVQANAIVIDKTIEFSYDHGLSIPLIIPPLLALNQSQPIHAAAEHVLRFGLIEGDAIVDGDVVVYDPQSAYSPALFHANGSKAKRLVIVCNRREAMLLTGETDVAAAASKLRSLDGAEAVIVKCGSHGAFLTSDSGNQHIPAFKTKRVWPIGSGDIFAATFFRGWCQGQSHIDAAMTASRSTAYFCDTRSLPVPNAASDIPQYEALSLRNVTAREARPRIYLAGPFFTMGQRWIVHEARTALVDQGLDVFSPYHDVGIGIASEVVPADIQGLREADVILAVLDGLDPGTLFEIGYARSLGKTVIGFCQNASYESLKMLVGTDCDIVDDFVSAIYYTAWAALRT
jgi:hypothetical protein